MHEPIFSNFIQNHKQSEWYEMSNDFSMNKDADDLMEEAKDSKLVSKLFTQGRHRNVSVILILQNAFPKGKFNT